MTVDCSSQDPLSRDRSADGSLTRLGLGRRTGNKSKLPLRYHDCDAGLHKELSGSNGSPFLFPPSSLLINPINYNFTSHNTGKMSAIVEEPEFMEPLKVLITLHDQMDSMDVIGPLEVFSTAQHDPKNPGMPIQSIKIFTYHIDPS